MATTKLLINNLDALSTWGVRMGYGFLEALNTPLEPKGYISNEMRNEHGKTFVVQDNQGNSLIRFKSRDLTLTFTIEGKNTEELERRKLAFYNVLYQGELTLKVPQNNENVYHLLYNGKPSAYAHNIQRTFCKVSLKFIEPNPMNRT